MLITNPSEKLRCKVYGPIPAPPALSGSRDAQELALYSNGLLGTDKVSVIKRYPQVAGLYERLDF
ncbi:hypothetical protein HGO21_34660 [Acinetobacter sp. CUI P1]|nr:hypothetical protein [Acinetobacter sp. CUI P1]